MQVKIKHDKQKINIGIDKVNTLQSPIWKEARIQTNRPTRCHIQWMDSIPKS